MYKVFDAIVEGVIIQNAEGKLVRAGLWVLSQVAFTRWTVGIGSGKGRHP